MANKIQGADFKSLSDLGGAGNEAKFITDDQIYITANSQNVTLKQSIINGTMGGTAASSPVINQSSAGPYSMSSTASGTQIMHTANQDVIYQLPSNPSSTKLFAFYNQGTQSGSNYTNELRIQPASGNILKFRGRTIENPGYLVIGKRGGSATIVNISTSVWVVTDVSYNDHHKNTTIASVKEINMVGRDTWTSKANSNTGQGEGASFPNLNGFGYIVTGTTTQGNETTAITTTQQYNDAANSWTNKANSVARRAPCGGTVNGFGYYMAGMNTAGTSITSTQQYNDSTNAFATKGNITRATSGTPPNATDINGYLYIAGGNASSGSTDLQQYNDNADTWTNKANMSVAKQSPASATLNGYIYIATGGTGGGPFTGSSSTTEQYNDSANAWITKVNNSVALTTVAVNNVLNGYFNIMGGSSDGSNGRSSNNQYNDSTNAYTAKTNMNNSRCFGHSINLNGYTFYENGFANSSGAGSSIAQQYN